MNILVLNGIPRPNGNTKQMIDAFTEGAVSAKHQVNMIDRFYSAAYPNRPPYLRKVAMILSSGDADMYDGSGRSCLAL